MLTPMPTSLVHGELLFEDNFDDNRNGWPDWDPNKFWIADGYYHISLGERESRSIFSTIEFPDLRNFVYEVAFQEIEGYGSYAYCLNFRANLPGEHYWQRFYSFEIVSIEQVYNLERVDWTKGDGNHWPASLVWRGYAPLIDKHVETHRLAVVAQETQFDLFVDGQLIDSVVDEEDLFPRGTIGLGVNHAHVAVDYVRVWTLPE